ncbi:MAG: hypothetical protein NVS1B4_13120 [Gemmatimonadaceae bacterium]
MRRFVIGLAVATLACRDVTKAPMYNIGLFVIEEAPSGTTAYKTRPEGRFYRAGGVSLFNSATARDECGVGPYPGPAADFSKIPGVDAGASIPVMLSGVTLPLARGTLTGSDIRRYALPGPADSMTVVPGDTAMFTIPGAPGGFSPATFRVKTSEAFTISPVPITKPASPTPFTLSWSKPPVVGSGSAMVVSLRYARAVSSIPDYQISCILADSGMATLSDGLVTEWYGSSVHQAEFNRVRTVFSPAGPDILAGLSFTTVKASY